MKAAKPHSANTREFEQDNARRGTRRRPARTTPVDESDLGSDIQSKNSLQGENQTARHNERQTMPDEGGDDA